MIIRRYQVHHVIGNLYSIVEERLVSSYKGRKCSAHWTPFQPTSITARGYRCAQRIAKLLDRRASFPLTFAQWGIR